MISSTTTANNKSLLNYKLFLLPEYINKTFLNTSKLPLSSKLSYLKSGFMKTWNSTYANSMHNSDSEIVNSQKTKKY